MGEARQKWFAGNRHRTLPVAASAAANSLPSAQKNTSPPAVARTPPRVVAGPTWGTSHAIRPVRRSIARRYFLGGSSGDSRVLPALNPLPASHSISRLEKIAQL